MRIECVCNEALKIHLPSTPLYYNVLMIKLSISNCYMIPILLLNLNYRIEASILFHFTDLSNSDVKNIKDSLNSVVRYISNKQIDLKQFNNIKDVGKVV